MTPPEQPRVWTLSGGLFGEPTNRVRANGPWLSASESVRVIEASVIADLLERAIPVLASQMLPSRQRVAHETEALLSLLRPKP